VWQQNLLLFQNSYLLSVFCPQQGLLLLLQGGSGAAAGQLESNSCSFLLVLLQQLGDT